MFHSRDALCCRWRAQDVAGRATRKCMRRCRSMAMTGSQTGTRRIKEDGGKRESQSSGVANRERMKKKGRASNHPVPGCGCATSSPLCLSQACPFRSQVPGRASFSAQQLVDAFPQGPPTTTNGSGNKKREGNDAEAKWRSDRTLGEWLGESHVNCCCGREAIDGTA